MRPTTPRPGAARRWRVALVLALGFGLGLAPPTLAADKSGVTPNTVSLPKGPGSIEGLGDAFAPLLSDGTGKYAVSLCVPAGTAGHTPTLALRYDGGNGSGPLGIGWGHGAPFIQRGTHRGIPRYIDGPNQLDDDQDGEIDETDEVDVCVDSDAAELVPVANADGGHTDYFRRHESSFVRYRRLSEGWEGRLPDGTRLEFGVTAAGRLTDTSTARTFKWLLERSVDTCGNTILFLYTRMADPQNTNQVYLEEIRYGPGAPTAGRTWPSFHFVRFTYEPRPDWFEDCRAGFVVRTGLRLRRLAMGTHGADLTGLGHAAGDFNSDGEPDSLDRAYVLSYEADPHWSLLTSVTPVGADNLSMLPPVTFTYTTATYGGTLSAAGAIMGAENGPAQVMDLPWVDLLDFNGDGLPDILRTNPLSGAHTVYLNRGEVAVGGSRAVGWSAGAEVGGDARAWSVNLADGYGAIAHLADMDADGLSDLVLVTGTDTYYFPNGRSESAPAWQSRRRMRLVEDGSAPPAPFGSPDVRIADLDSDKRIDIIQSLAVGDGARYRVWFNLDGARYSRGITVVPGMGFMFSDTGIHIADLNGDRVPDIARIRAADVWVTAGTGYGHFEPVVPVAIPDWTLDSDQVRQAVLEDITGDGLADLVVERAAPGQLWVWENRGNYTLGPRGVVTGLPTQFGTAPARRWADLNGNGTVDLVYADGAASPSLQTVDIGRLLGCVPTPHLLVGVDNGIGRRITIRYGTTTAAALADAAGGAPWPDPLPFPIDVVAEVCVDDSRGNQTTSRFSYHEGYYDDQEHQFGGFARVVQIDDGDETATSLVSRFAFDTGKNDRAMRGNLLGASVEDLDGGVFSAETTAWATRVLCTGTNGREVRFAHPTRRTRDTLELGRGTPQRTEVEFAYDNLGNQTAVRDYGVVVGGERGAFGDERLTETQYAYDLGNWLIRSPLRTTLRDLGGTVISREETYYDDPTFSGANPGLVTAGLPTLVRRWVDPANEAAAVQTVRTQYDTYGNPVVLLDPLAVAHEGAIDDDGGHYRTVNYDAAFYAYPVAETVHLEAGKTDLAIQASYDAGLGVMTASVDPNGHTTTYGHDTFGRLTRILRPDDDPNYPSTEYEYALGQPVGAARQTGSTERAAALVNWVETRLLDREPGSAATRREHYLISRAFVDGLGRQLMAKAEAEDDSQTGAPRVTVTGAVCFNARGSPAATLNPFYTLLGGALDAQLAFEDIAATGWEGSFHLNGGLVPLGLAGAHTTRVTYDATLRPLRTTNPDGTAVEMVYEPFGIIAADENDTDPASPYHGTPTARWSDGLGRLIRVDEVVRLNDDGTPGNALQTWPTSYQYRADGLLTLLTDSQNNAKSFEYDGLGRRTALHDPDRGTMRYAYDAASNLVQSADAKGQVITYAYDGANRLLTETYSPAPGGRVASRAAAKSPDVTYHYDRPAGMIDFGNGDAGSATNTRARLAWVEDLSGEEHTSYDDRGREAWVVKCIPDPLLGTDVSYTSHLSHDSVDRLVELVYPDGDRCRYEYDEGGLVERIVGGESANLAGTPYVVAGTDHAPSGQPVTTLYGNGVRTTHRYDSRLRLTRLRTAPAARLQGVATVPLIDCGYSFDSASNILSLNDLRDGTRRASGDPRRNTQRFQYDDLYRLTRVQYSLALPGEPDRDDGHIAYRYDRLGNSLEQTSSIVHADERTGLPVCNLGAVENGGALGSWNRVGRVAGDPPGPHALTKITPPTARTASASPDVPAPGSEFQDPSSRAYPYDANGNMTEIDGLACAWDVLDRLVAVENDRMRAEYGYDYTGRRIWKRVWEKDAEGRTEALPSDATVYVGRHFEIREYDQPIKHVFDGDTRVASITGTLDPSRPRVQRFRVSPGWNLLSLAVDLPSSAPLFQAASALFLWDGVGGGYVPLGPTEPLPAGSILWLQGDHAGTLVLAGTYTEPGSLPIPAGGAFVGGLPLAAWRADSALPALARAWRFDPLTQQWQVKVSTELTLLSGFPAFMRPGEPVYVASGTPSTLNLPPSAGILYYHQDHLGSSAVIADGDGNLVDETAYYPYGYPRRHDRPEAARGLLPSRYGFAQKEQDEETGLHYFEARYLVAALGRFASVDPLAASVPAGWLADPRRPNGYAYALNRPTLISDPTGLDGDFPRKPQQPFSQAAHGMGWQRGVCTGMSTAWLASQRATPSGSPGGGSSLEAAFQEGRVTMPQYLEMERAYNRGPPNQNGPLAMTRFMATRGLRAAVAEFSSVAAAAGFIERMGVGTGAVIAIEIGHLDPRATSQRGHAVYESVGAHGVAAFHAAGGWRYMDPNLGEYAEEKQSFLGRLLGRGGISSRMEKTVDTFRSNPNQEVFRATVHYVEPVGTRAELMARPRTP